MTDMATLDTPRSQQGQRNQHGDFIWYELLTSDPDAAQEFYREVVGWNARDAGMGGDMDYRLLSARDGSDVAGLMALTDEMKTGGARPGGLGNIGGDDVDKPVDDIKAAGGAVHMPPDDIPDVGRFAMVADPQGVVFYVMRGDGQEQSEAFKPMADGHGAWNELVTTDQAAALDFYLGRFGWEKGEAMPMGEAGDYRFVHHHGEMIGAVMNRMDERQPPMWNYYFRVPSIAKAVETIGGNGGTITYGPQEVPGGDFVINAIDPQGAMFGLVGPEK